MAEAKVAASLPERVLAQGFGSNETLCSGFVAGFEEVVGQAQTYSVPPRHLQGCLPLAAQACMKAGCFFDKSKPWLWPSSLLSFFSSLPALLPCSFCLSAFLSCWCWQAQPLLPCLGSWPLPWLSALPSQGLLAAVSGDKPRFLTSLVLLALQAQLLHSPLPPFSLRPAYHLLSLSLPLPMLGFTGWLCLALALLSLQHLSQELILLLQQRHQDRLLPLCLVDRAGWLRHSLSLSLTLSHSSPRQQPLTLPLPCCLPLAVPCLPGADSLSHGTEAALTLPLPCCLPLAFAMSGFGADSLSHCLPKPSSGFHRLCLAVCPLRGHVCLWGRLTHAQIYNFCWLPGCQRSAALAGKLGSLTSCPSALGLLCWCFCY